MSPLKDMLENKRRNGKKVLSIFLTAGYPEPAATLPLLEAIVAGGADLIELGVPFSDPMADGPTIQSASQQALAAGTTLPLTLDLLRQFTARHSTPVLLMGYANPFYQFGWERLMQEASQAGAAGFIIPDIPPEESGELQVAARHHQLDLVFLVSPNTPEARVAQVVENTSAFIYAVSLTGTTGAREGLPAQTGDFLQRLRRQTDHPILVGFGVSNPETARMMCQWADGVIIGSAVIQQIASAPDLESACRAVTAFVKSIRLGIAGE